MSNFNFNERIDEIVEGLWHYAHLEDGTYPGKMMAVAPDVDMTKDDITQLLRDFVAEVMPEKQTEDHCKECRAATKGYNASLEDIQANVERALETKHD